MTIDESNPKARKERQLEGNLAFVKEVAKYFMDFLETDFHKHKSPRRTVKLRNSDNLLVGLNLAKYSSFEREIFGLIGKAFKHDGPLTVARGDYRTVLPKNLLELIKLQVEKVPQAKINETVAKIADEIEKAAALFAKEQDKAITSALDATAQALKKGLVLPFIENIEKPLENLAIGDENDLYLVEEELTEVLAKLLEGKVANLVTLLGAGEKPSMPRQLKAVFDLEEVKSCISAYFESLKVGDLFSDLFEMGRNKAIVDKQEFYLYFCDITFERNKYPIFYLPFSAEQKGENFDITFDSQIYINKRALEFIVQEYNNQKGTRGTLKTISDRLIYISQQGSGLVPHLNAILSEIVNLFELDHPLNLASPVSQSARSLMVRASNSAYIALFDKSDEALVNDYEEILQQLNSENGELAKLFNKLVDDFIHKNPSPINPSVESEWDNKDTPEKLVFASPIPLNGEQLQLLSAIQKPGCKYVIVEGPPGTGKSHTITAIAFDAILRHQSVLILSDKKEALDVVEEKITGTMDKVRFGEGEFQNPILRLGKIGNTYNQILARPTLEKIKLHQRAVKKELPKLDENIEKLQKSLKEDVEAEVVAFGNVDMAEVHEFSDLEAFYAREEFPFDLDELLERPKAADFLEESRAFLKTLQPLFEDRVAADILGLKLESLRTVDEARAALVGVSLIANALGSLREQCGDDLNEIAAFKEFSDGSLHILKALHARYLEAKLPLVGYLFAGAKLDRLDEEFRRNFPFAEHRAARAAVDRIGVAIKSFEHICNLRAHGVALGIGSTDYLKSALTAVINDEAIVAYARATSETLARFDRVVAGTGLCPKSVSKIGITSSDFGSWYNNRLLSMPDSDFKRALGFVSLKRSLDDTFAAIPKASYAHQKSQIEELITTRVTHLLDTRLVDFYTNNQSDAETLRNIIRGKRRFPKEQFSKLKDAFPCILAGIRDYAEYIPLEPEIFDLVIIDEASQVSIAQAFPALIRAKKVVILGDKKQFSNVKSAQARSETNREYLNSIGSVFRREVSEEDSKLIKLSKFDIKTSILEFFEFISNYQTQLLKHFRGYRELISYSNEKFYLRSLQVMKIRSKRIDEVIKFKILEHDQVEAISNTNRKEIEFIIEELKAIKDAGGKSTVGIITPHTNQQKLLMDQISRLPDRDFYFEKLKLKIMTFDTCQGEERDVIIYSMVANSRSDKLWGVFIKSFEAIESEEDGRIKVQRLNVGFSRAKECVHFVLSKPLEKYEGAIGDALRHFHNTLEEGKKEKSAADVDQTSKMEPLVLTWFYQTEFWAKRKDRIEFQPQFEIGEYLKQLDPTYEHPAYKVDFLLLYRDETHKEHKIIIEYDGFQEHFGGAEHVNELNYDQYYSEDDVYRQKVLESYDYSFLRINRFNVGKNPVATLDERIGALISRAPANSRLLDNVHDTIGGLETGQKKECPKCREIRNLEDFSDESLLSGYGRFCNECKSNKAPAVSRSSPSERTVSTTAKSCPRCSSSMVLRKGTRGRFYGCTRYPMCRGTRSA